MRKKISILLVVLLIGLCCGCGKSSNVTEKSIVNDSTENSNEQSLSKDKSESKYESFHGYMFSHPSSFNMKKYYLSSAQKVYYGKLNSNYEVNLFLKQKELNVVNNDVAEAFKPYIQDLLEQKYHAVTLECSYVTEKEEYVKLLGKDFVRQTGIINTDLYDDDVEKSKFYYTAYFGLMDFPEHGEVNQPMIIMSFSEGTDEQTKKDVQAVADQAYSSFQKS